MKKFKNVFLLVAMAVSVVAFTGCEKDKDGEDNNNQTNAWDGVLTATATDVVDAPDDATVDSVKVLIGDYVAGSGEYKNGGFTLTLSPLPANYHVPITERLPAGVTANPADAKGYFPFDYFYVYAYRDGNQVGRFGYLNPDARDSDSVC